MVSKVSQTCIFNPNLETKVRSTDVISCSDVQKCNVFKKGKHKGVKEYLLTPSGFSDYWTPSQHFVKFSVGVMHMYLFLGVTKFLVT